MQSGKPFGLSYDSIRGVATLGARTLVQLPEWVAMTWMTCCACARPKAAATSSPAIISRRRMSITSAIARGNEVSPTLLILSVRRTVALPIYAVAPVLDLASSAFGKPAAWIARDDRP
jgi:hypothetical protein